MRIIRVLLVLLSIAAFISAANITVQHMSGSSAMTGNSSINPFIKLTNNDAGDFAMDNYQVEYYFYDPTMVASNLSAPIDWCKINGASDVTELTSAALSDLNPISDSQAKKANIVVVYTFNAGTVLQQNEFMEIHARIHKTTWQYTFDENDDWSFQDLNAFATANNIVVREKSSGTIIWGTEPTSFDPYVSPIFVPSDGAVLPSGEFNFSWSQVSDVTGYEFWLETAAGLGDIAHFGGDGTMATSYLVSNLPVDGSPIYARLKVYHAGGPQLENLTYTAYTNHAPTDIEIHTQAITENMPIGTHIVLINSVADDPGDTHTFSLDPSLNDNSYFSIVGNKINTAAVLDYEEKNGQYTLTVKVTDNYGASFDKTFTIGIFDIEPEYQYPEVTGADEDMVVDGESLYKGKAIFEDSLKAVTLKSDVIIASQVVMTPKWQIVEPVPDYVFDSDYKLPSIENVKEYVEANKHLEGIPSANEVKTQGLDIYSFNVSLLKKIEELTLYVIKLNEKIKDQEQQIETMKEDVVKTNE